MSMLLRLAMLIPAMLLALGPNAGVWAQQAGVGDGMTFFVTSIGSGSGADLGGRICCIGRKCHDMLFMQK